MMGEATKLTTEESGALLRRVMRRVDGRVPVVVGVSNPGLTALSALAKESMDEGAAGIMVAPQPSQKTEEQVIGYFAAVCEAVGPSVPIVLQDFPLGVGVTISVPTIEAIADRMPQVVMLKHEDWPGLAKLSRLRRNEREQGRRRLSVLVGNGGLFVPQEIRRGADGAMTGYAFPDMLVEVCRRIAAGDDGAEDLFDAHLPVIRHETQPGTGLAVRKEILRRRGALASAHVRTPGPRLDPADHAEIDALMRRLERRLAALGISPR
jgi:4-hydroxy-tetrahydrodipicolinate synthase